jgi:hypothetical protein
LSGLRANLVGLEVGTEAVLEDEESVGCEEAAAGTMRRQRLG